MTAFKYQAAFVLSLLIPLAGLSYAQESPEESSAALDAVEENTNSKETELARADTGSAASETEASADFRQTRWGMSRSEVQLNETARLTEDAPELLGYLTEVNGLRTAIAYMFQKDELISAMYVFDYKRPFLNWERATNNFHSLSELLSKKYGPLELESADKNKNHTINEEIRKNYPTTHGQVRGALWQNENTRVVLLLIPEANSTRPALFALYMSKDHDSGKILQDMFNKEKRALRDL